MQYISGCSGLSGVMEWTAEMFTRLIEAFEYLQKTFDYIVFDMGAGATSQTLDLLISVDDIIVITTAEPTSITDAYSMMKYIYYKDSEKNFYLICNRAFSDEEGAETTGRLKLAMSKFLSKEITILGVLPEDSVVRKAVREQIPFSILYPQAEITKKLKNLVYTFTDLEDAIEAKTKQNNFISRLKSLFSGRT